MMNKNKLMKHLAKFVAVLMTIMYVEKVYTLISGQYQTYITQELNVMSASFGIYAITICLVWFIPFGTSALIGWYFGFRKEK